MNATSLYMAATAFFIFSVFCSEDDKRFTAIFSFLVGVAHAITASIMWAVA